MKKKGNPTASNLKSAKICVIGLGNVGYPTAVHIQKCGFDVVGYDVDEKKVLNIKLFPAFNNWNSVPECDVYIICVNTSWTDGPDMSNIYDVCTKIASKGTGIPLVSIESTVSIGTSHRVAELFKDVNLVHCPHRFWSENPEKHGVIQLRVIGGVDEESLIRGVKLYNSLSVPLHKVENIEISEISKIAENSYRFVQIAFAEQLWLICREIGLNFRDVRKAVNTKWNIEILQALEGIGGDCLPKDIKFLAALIKETSLLEGALKIDELYKEFHKVIKPKIKTAIIV